MVLLLSVEQAMVNNIILLFFSGFCHLFQNFLSLRTLSRNVQKGGGHYLEKDSVVKIHDVGVA